MLAQQAQANIDRQRYADAYYQKNAGTVGRLGFDSWWNENHAMPTYMSKAIPYEVPRLQSGAPDPSNLEKGVTYNLTLKNGQAVRGIWTGNNFQTVQQ